MTTTARLLFPDAVKHWQERPPKVLPGAPLPNTGPWHCSELQGSFAAYLNASHPASATRVHAEDASTSLRRPTCIEPQTSEPTRRRHRCSDSFVPAPSIWIWLPSRTSRAYNTHATVAVGFKPPGAIDSRRVHEPLRACVEDAGHGTTSTRFVLRDIASPRGKDGAPCTDLETLDSIVYFRDLPDNRHLKAGQLASRRHPTKTKVCRAVVA
jgi:hypothetical protein